MCSKTVLLEKKLFQQQAFVLYTRFLYNEQENNSLSISQEF